MLDQYMIKGAQDACAKFGVKEALAPGVWDKVKSFGSGQMGAAKDLFANLRGGLGGQMNPNVVTGPVPAHSMDMARASHRQQALGNLKTLAPSLLAGGGLYMMHRHGKQQDEQRRQQAMMQQQQGGYPPM